jgi:hypothetical protein
MHPRLGQLREPTAARCGAGELGADQDVPGGGPGEAAHHAALPLWLPHAASPQVMRRRHSHRRQHGAPARCRAGRCPSRCQLATARRVRRILQQGGYV